MTFGDRSKFTKHTYNKVIKNNMTETTNKLCQSKNIKVQNDFSKTKDFLNTFTYYVQTQRVGNPHKTKMKLFHFKRAKQIRCLIKYFIIPKRKKRETFTLLIIYFMMITDWRSDVIVLFIECLIFVSECASTSYL